MIVDSHIHFWDDEFPEKVWIRRKIAALGRSFTPEDLKPLMRAAGVDGVVLVQAAPEEAETRYFLEIADKEDIALGVVGWVNLEDGVERLGASLDAFQRHPKFKGVRNHPPREFDGSWLRDPKAKRGYAQLVERGLPCDLMVTCRQLADTRELLLEVPDLTAVINHGGRPSVMAGELEPWASDMRAIADDTKAFVKVSGLIERASQEWTAESVRPWVEFLLEVFGGERLIFGSNWPVMTIMGTYGGWWEALQDILDAIGAPAADRKALLGGTATKVYRLDGAD